MVMPSENNPLFNNDKPSSNSDDRDNLFADVRDPRTHTFKTDDGNEMTLRYNINDINSYSSSKSRQNATQGENKEMVNLIDNEKRLQNLNNPWLTESYNTAKRFYDADSKLEYQDRMSLANTYQRIRDGQLRGMYAGLVMSFAAPYLWIYHKHGGGGWSAFTKNGSNPAVRMAFLKVNNKLPRILVFAVFGMIVCGNINGARVYNMQVHRLENNLSNGNQGVYNQYQILQMTQPLESQKWEHYYRITSVDSTRMLRDPREAISRVIDKADEYTKKKMDSGQPFKGGAGEQNVFNTVDIAKGEQELYERTGQRSVNGIPMSPYSRRYNPPQSDVENTQSEPEIDISDNKYDNANNDDPYFQKEKNGGEKSGWWN